MRLEREFAVMLGHVAVLMAISIVAVASASLDVAAARYGDAFLILRRWVAYWVVGWAVLGLSAYAPWDRLRRASFALVLGVVVLALLPLVPKLGVRINGAARWITLGGITLQPAEFLKPALVLYLAHYFDRKGDEGQSGRAIVPPLVVVGLSGVALLLQPDFGDAVLLVGVALAMAVAAGVPGRLLVLVLVLGALAAAAVATYAPYRFARLLAFIDPWAHRWDSGYQLAQSLLAFGSGGLFGTGVGLGIQKLFYLPEVFTDFIAAAWAEETGFIGVLALLGAFVALIVRMLAWAIAEGRGFARLLLVGAAASTGLGAMVNLGVEMGLLPTKGLPLPFVSYGGSALVAQCVLIGMAGWALRTMPRNRRRKA